MLANQVRVLLLLAQSAAPVVRIITLLDGVGGVARSSFWLRLVDRLSALQKLSTSLCLRRVGVAGVWRAGVAVCGHGRRTKAQGHWASMRGGSPHRWHRHGGAQRGVRRPFCRFMHITRGKDR